MVVLFSDWEAQVLRAADLLRQARRLEKSKWFRSDNRRWVEVGRAQELREHAQIIAAGDIVKSS